MMVTIDQFLIGVNHFESDLQFYVFDELFGCNQVQGQSTERQRRNLIEFWASDRIGSAFELQSYVLLGVKDIELILELVMSGTILEFVPNLT